MVSSACCSWSETGVAANSQQSALLGRFGGAPGDGIKLLFHFFGFFRLGRMLGAKAPMTGPNF
jgi:hypothetical protein